MSTDDQSIASVPDRMPLDEVRKAVIDVSLEDLFKPSSRRITGLARKWVILENGFLAHFAGPVSECREFAQFLEQCDLRIFDGEPQFPSSLKRSIYSKQLEAIIQTCILQPDGSYNHKLAALNGRQHSPVEGCSCTEIGSGAKFISPAIIKSLSETLVNRNIDSRNACLGAMGMLTQFERLLPHEFISSGVGGGIEGVVPKLDGKHHGEWQPVGDALFLFGNIFNLRGVQLLRLIPVVIIQKYTENGTFYLSSRVNDQFNPNNISVGFAADIMSDSIDVNLVSKLDIFKFENIVFSYLVLETPLELVEDGYAIQEKSLDFNSVVIGANNLHRLSIDPVGFKVNRDKDKVLLTLAGINADLNPGYLSERIGLHGCNLDTGDLPANLRMEVRAKYAFVDAARLDITASFRSDQRAGNP